MTVHHKAVALLTSGLLLTGVLGAVAATADPAPTPTVGSDAQHVQVQGYGGVLLDGYVRMPTVAAGTKVPVIIWSSPYFGTVAPMPSNPAADTVYDTVGFTVDYFVQHGYAVAMFSVRGTGNSQGCFEFFGPDEQRDQVNLVDWAAAQPWSSGAVGMIGDSYDATVALEAAVQAPAALKAVIAVAPVPDVYQMYTTPQGALWTSTDVVPPVFAGISAVPGEDPQAVAEDPQTIAAAHTTPCPDTQPALSELALDPVTRHRDAAFWEARDLVPLLGDVRAAVLYTDGFYDDQYFEGENVFDKFTHAPFSYIVGPWPHQTPPGSPPFYQSAGLQWFDHYLKGIGPTPPFVGEARWQDASVPGTSTGGAVDQAVNGGTGFPSGDWHTSAAWPPPEATQDTLFLDPDGRLGDSRAAGAATYLSMPSTDGTSSPLLGPGGWYTPKSFACPTNALPGAAGRLTYVTSAATRSGLVAGNPSVDMDVTSTAPAGVVSAYLVDLPPGFCTSDGPEKATLLSFGAADLRYVNGGYDAHDFPTGRVTRLHIDMTALGQVVAPRDSLALIIGEGNGIDRQTAAHPTITVQGTSRLTLPLERPFA